MTQRTWSTTEVSAYLDGQLEPRHQAAIEADMERNSALRQRVEEMRRVVSLLRAEPLRQAPRNYLLTPAMVAEATPHRARAAKPGPRRRMSLLGLRLATAMVTLAFVVTFGMTALQGNLMPAMPSGASEAPEAAVMSQDREAVEQYSGEAVPEEAQGEPELRLAPPEAEAERHELEALPMDTPAAAPPEGSGLTEAERQAQAPAGMGGAVETPEPEMSALAMEAPASEETPLASEFSDEAPADSPSEKAEPRPDAGDLQREPAPVQEAVTEDEAQDGNVGTPPGEADLGETPLAQGSDDVTAQEDSNGARLTWISRGLGIAALVLAAVTLWLTYQPLSRRK